LEDAGPKRRHRVCRPPRLDAGFRPEGPLETSVSFEEVAEEAEGLSYCNPSPIGFPNDKPPSIKFRALPSEGDAELCELVRT
jgi:hypothetical protein